MGYWKLDQRACLLYSGRKLSRISSCRFVVSRIVGDKLGYLTDEISKQSVEGVTSSLHAAYSKMWDERDKLKELWSKNGSRTWWFGKFSVYSEYKSE